jgi:hypothetical protein
MPHSPRIPLSERIRVELIEADIEQAFGLVDLAESESAAGHAESSIRILQDADRVFLDIHDRLAKLGASGAAPFTLLIAELRKSIERARSHPSR